MVLPSSLLSELAEISKLLVGRQQIEKVAVGRPSGSWSTRSCLQSSSLAGRVNVVDDNDRLEDDWDLSRTPRSEEVDLFDEGTSVHSGASGQKSDSSDAICGPGGHNHSGFSEWPLRGWNHRRFFLQGPKVCFQRTIWPSRTWLSWQFWTSCVSALLSSPSTACFSSPRRCGAGCCCCWSSWTSAEFSISTWWVSCVRVRVRGQGLGLGLANTSLSASLLVPGPAEEASCWRLSGTRGVRLVASPSCVCRLSARSHLPATVSR